MWCASETDREAPARLFNVCEHSALCNAVAQAPRFSVRLTLALNLNVSPSLSIVEIGWRQTRCLLCTVFPTERLRGAFAGASVRAKLSLMLSVDMYNFMFS